MDITGYQAATVEMERKETKAGLVPLGHVVRKETRAKMAQTLTTETGNSVRGGVQTAVTLDLSRIVFSKRGKVIPLSVLFTKATFICIATTAASDGSSPSMVPSAVVHCPLMSFGGWQALVITPTNQEQ